MAKRLGGMFLTCALGPVNYAGSCIQAGRVLEGLQELAPDGLHGAYQRGIDQIAARVGIPSADIERLLPGGAIRGVLQKISATQKGAIDTWNLHAGHVGGLLSGVAELTVDGRAPDASLCLERLAKKVSRDKPFAEPLQALSVDVGEWQDILAQCQSILDDGRAFEEAYRRRRIRTYAIAVACGLVASSIALTFLRYHTARGHVDAALATGDPCTVEKLSAPDLDKASSAQLASVGDLRAQCEERRVREQKAIEEKRRADEIKRAEEKKKAELDAACDALAAHVEGGRTDEADAAFAGASAALLDRVARGALDRSDLGPNDPDLPCKDANAGAKIGAAFDAAVMKSKAWSQIDDPSPRVREVLAKNSADLPDWPKRLLTNRVESTAKKAIVSGEPGLVARSTHLCELEAAVGIPNGPPCRSLLALSGKQ